MYRLTGRTSDCADGKRLRDFFRIAVVAFCPALLDNLDLAIEAHRTTLDQGHVGCEAHLVDVAAGIEVVEGIEDEREGLKPFDIELGIFDIGMLGGEGDRWVEL